MGITAKTARECYERFREHVAKVMAATLTAEPLAVYEQHNRFTLGFAVRQPVPVTTRDHGTLYFGFSQSLDAVKVRKREFRLRTVGYWYRLQDQPGVKAKALIRWEYEQNNPRNSRPARHHTQAAAKVPVGSAELDLNKLHVPTGRVPFEEVVRFILHDLGASGQSRDWAERLAESEREFYTSFMTYGDYPYY